MKKTAIFAAIVLSLGISSAAMAASGGHGSGGHSNSGSSNSMGYSDEIKQEQDADMIKAQKAEKEELEQIKKKNASNTMDSGLLPVEPLNEPKTTSAPAN